jgi:sulfate-transporting ATPase
MLPFRRAKSAASVDSARPAHGDGGHKAAGADRTETVSADDVATRADGDVVNEPAAAAGQPVSERMRVRERVLRLQGLTVRYGGVTAVNGVDLEVAAGEIVGLIGPNGAGKTSLIDAVSGFTKPSSGRVLLGDIDLLRYSASKRARAGVARSWQSLELFEDVSVRENLQVGSDSDGFWTRLARCFWPTRSELSPQTWAAIRDCGLEDDLDRMPSDIPYGRRRLVGIARAVAMSPSTLLVDEPAAGLSDQEARELGMLLRRLAREWGMGILLVEHNVELVMDVCDRVVVVDFGTRIASGPPAEIRSDASVVAAYLGSGETIGDNGSGNRLDASLGPELSL